VVKRLAAAVPIVLLLIWLRLFTY